MKQRLTALFYLNYARNTARRDRFRRRLATAVCAGAVAFVAMCGGYLQSFSAAQGEYIKSLSERQLVVYNNTVGEECYWMGYNEPIPSQEAEAIYAVDRVENAVPVVRFVTIPQMTGGLCQYSEWAGYSDEEIRQEMAFSFHYANRSGVSVDVPPEEVGVFDTGLASEGEYSVWSYAIENCYDPRCEVLDLTVKDGAYLTRQMADQLGITDEMLNGLTLTFEILIPVSSDQGPVYIESSNGDGTYDAFWRRENGNYYEKATVQVMVRGIFPIGDYDPYLSSMNVGILMPGDQMLQIVKERLDPENKNLTQIVKALEEDLPPEYYSQFPVQPEVSTERTAETWAPEAYYVVAEDLAAVEQVKEDLLKINPNFSIHQEFQDYRAGVQYVSNSRGVLFYVSYAVLAVVFLLTALVYVSLIDKRKYEFAVLRANGLTKREVRGVIYAEMALQFVLIFVVGLLFAGLIYFIGGKWLGYPFQFDGMTVLWLSLISLGAIVLPTTISLLFVNRFEPDQVMRN